MCVLENERKMSYFDDDDDVDYGALIAAAEEAERKKSNENNYNNRNNNNNKNAKQNHNIANLFQPKKDSGKCKERKSNDVKHSQHNLPGNNIQWPKPGQLGTSSSGNKLDWACSKCTFLNPLSKSHCGACGGVNPSHKKQWSIGYKSYGTISNKLTKSKSRAKRNNTNSNITAERKKSNKQMAIFETNFNQHSANNSHNNNIGFNNNNNNNNANALKKKEAFGQQSILNMQSERNSNNHQYHGKKIPSTMDNNNYGKSNNNKLINAFQIASRSSDLQSKPLLPIDPTTKHNWFYPTNYPIRQYQRSIVESALYQNTLVVLPTGLGKTFIAAVVMYNYYRWFPGGKIIFMAPTKPLVEQQVKACHQIMSVPLEVTARLDGSIKAVQRKVLWKERQLFFCTPQTFRNDIAKGYVDVRKIVCLVFDEAHRASGNYAYTVVTQQIIQQNRHFRILALSATPGSTKDGVQHVIDNLLISNIEVRGDNDPDVKKHTHTKLMDFVNVKQKASGAVARLRMQWIEIIRPLVRRLAAKHILFNSNPEQITKANAWRSMKAFQDRFYNGQLPPGITGQEAKSLLGQLSFLISLGHANDLLKNHGLESFIDNLSKLNQKVQNTSGSSYKREIVNGLRFQRLFKEARDVQSRGGEQHPKVLALIDLLTDHFNRAKQCGRETKAIIFTEWRSSVDNIIDELEHLKPLVKPSGFVGQAGSSTSATGSKKKKGRKKKGAKSSESGTTTTTKREKGKGMTQKEQQRVMQEFRDGKLNVLVCTSIGEEGLDIGSVDLIISFDAVGSPTRMVQRFGRTGRKRSGRIVVLMTEDDKKKQKMATQKSEKIKSLLLRGSSSFMLYNHNPLMLPEDSQPECVEQSMEISLFSPSRVGGAAKKDKKINKNGRKNNDNDAWMASNSQKHKFETTWGFNLTNSQHGKVNQFVDPAKLFRNSVQRRSSLGQKTYQVQHSERTKLYLNMLNFKGLYDDIYDGLQMEVDEKKKSLQQQKERRGNDGKPKKKTSFEDNWMDEDFDDFHDIPSTNNKNREENTNNSTGANEKQMKSNTIDKRQKKKINSLPFSEKEEKFDINTSNDIGKAREGQDEYLQKFKTPMPISTKEHSMNQLIKSYLQDKDPDDVDYDSVIKYVYSKMSHGGEKVNGMNIFKAKYQLEIQSKVDAYVTNKEHNPMQDTIIVENIDVLNSTTVVDEENEQNDSTINSHPVIDLCDDNIVEEHRKMDSTTTTTTNGNTSTIIDGESNSQNIEKILTDEQLTSGVANFILDKGPSQKFKVLRNYLENMFQVPSLKIHDRQIKDIAIRLAKDMMQSNDGGGNVLQTSYEKENVNGSSIDASVNEKIFVTPSIAKKKMGTNVSQKKKLEEKYNVGDRVRVRDGGDWWLAIIKSTKRVGTGKMLYNLVSDEHDEETSWEMYDVHPKNMKKRHSNYPFSQVSSLNSDENTSMYESDSAENSQKQSNFMEETFVQGDDDDEKDEDAVNDHIQHSNFKKYFQSKYEKRDKESVVQMFESAIEVTKGSELVPPPPIFNEADLNDIQLDETQEDLSPLLTRKNGGKGKKAILVLEDDDDDDDDDDDESSDGKDSIRRNERNPIYKPKIKNSPSAFENDDDFEDAVDDDTPCSICKLQDTTDENPILFCDGCNLAFHQACYGIKKIPSGDYFCDMCINCSTKKNEYRSMSKGRLKRNACCLCPNGWLPLQRSKCNRWVHPQCVMFIGETYFENSNIANLNNIDVERKQLVCEICSPQSLSKNIDSYPCIQCDAGDCMRSFHVTCAQQKGFSRMIVDDNNGQLVGKTYCPDHLHYFNKSIKTVRKKNIYNDNRKRKKSNDYNTRKERNQRPPSKLRKVKRKNGQIQKRKQRREAYVNELIEEEADISGDESAHRNDMDVNGNNEYYDVNDTFIHDTQSSHDANTPQGYLAFRNAFSQDSVVGLDVESDNLELNGANANRRRRARTAMPIIEQCLREIG